ncbi:unnamed protein product [Symbiodinium pilosum]|uniref:Uncharacterized protein n=1 Tax=Symbiodinium pilosum TaxID=2952 RepID=A0A812X578_SYMPI|nr:unnamed protein product [Symbiodinium pilosum]
MLLWCTDAVEVEVISAAEKPFSLSATLRLHTVSQVINASMSMARDSAMDPFTWRLSASGPDGQALLTFHNFGFPFLWHRLDWKIDNLSTSEQLYGSGESTFEHQLGSFREAVRGRRQDWLKSRTCKFIFY